MDENEDEVAKEKERKRRQAPRPEWSFNAHATAPAYRMLGSIYQREVGGCVTRAPHLNRKGDGLESSLISERRRGSLRRADSRCNQHLSSSILRLHEPIALGQFPITRWPRPTCRGLYFAGSQWSISWFTCVFGWP